MTKSYILRSKLLSWSGCMSFRSNNESEFRIHLERDFELLFEP